MGAWGSGPFDNDMAMDLLLEYEERGADVLVDWLDGAAEGGGYIDADIGSAVIAAGEIVAACHGFAMTVAIADFPMGADPAKLVDQMLTHQSEVVEHDDLTRDVKALVGPALVDPATSELAELWAESDENAAFLASVADLQARLAKVDT